MRVTVWTYPGFWEQAAAAMVRTLDDLGYRASIRRTTNIQMLAARATDEKTRGLQAGMIGWYGVRRAAASLLDLFKCSPRDWSFFCDRKINARIARAVELDATDLDRAVAVWRTLERDIVDLAPWVPLFTPAGATVVSERVGNYQYNPEWWTLLDQLWVR